MEKNAGGWSGRVEISKEEIRPKSSTVTLTWHAGKNKIDTETPPKAHPVSALSLSRIRTFTKFQIMVQEEGQSDFKANRSQALATRPNLAILP